MRQGTRGKDLKRKDLFLGIRIRPETKTALEDLAKKDKRSVSFITRQILEKVTKTGEV
jgi:predicted DNA-binding protein